MASGQRVPVNKQAKISFQIGPHYFQEFLILFNKASVVLGNPFFKKHHITIDPKKQFDTITRLNSTVESNLADNLIEFDPQLISVAKMRNPDDFEGGLNQLIQDFHFKKNDTPTGCPPPDFSKLWFPTPETCNDFSLLTPLQREIYDPILQLQRQEKMDPENNEADKLEFSEKISWDTCVLNADQKGNLMFFWLNTTMCLPNIALM